MRSLAFPITLLLAITSYHVTASPLKSRATSKADYIRNAMDAEDVLFRQWYDSSTGRWQDYWWQSANILTTLAGLAEVNPDYKNQAIGIFQEVFTNAKASNGGNWLNEFYDDEGWWALAWIKVYDLTQDGNYLSTAQEIFEDLKGGFGAPCDAQWWDKDHTAVNTVNNALYLSVAASLANRVADDQKSEYQDAAASQLNWMFSHGLETSNNTLVDGLSLDDCSPQGAVYTYNQGVILGAIVEMNKFNGDASLDKAAEIAQGALDHLTSDGILTEFAADWGRDDTAAMFKGVFVRNLAILQGARGNGNYVSFLQQNADTLWANDRSSDGQLGAGWQGPVQAVSAPSHDSALDCLVAAAAVSS